jgi:hypothetical protein
MTTEQNYRQKTLAAIPPLLENHVWRPVDVADQHRIECERFSSCGEDATWVTRQGNLYVCDYHRFLFEVLRATQEIPFSNLSATGENSCICSRKCSIQLK